MKTNESMIAAAIKILGDKKTQMPFAELWAAVKERLEITPEEEADRIGHFYSDLFLAGETIALPGNAWDLRERHTYEEAHVNIADAYEEEQGEVDEEEAQEEREYDESVQGTLSSGDDDFSEESGEEGESSDREDRARLEATVLR